MEMLSATVPNCKCKLQQVHTFSFKVKNISSVM
jgi:hypothetical protein